MCARGGCAGTERDTARGLCPPGGMLHTCLKCIGICIGTGVAIGTYRDARGREDRQVCGERTSRLCTTYIPQMHTQRRADVSMGIKEQAVPSERTQAAVFTQLHTRAAVLRSAGAGRRCQRLRDGAGPSAGTCPAHRGGLSPPAAAAVPLCTAQRGADSTAGAGAGDAGGWAGTCRPPLIFGSAAEAPGRAKGTRLPVPPRTGSHFSGPRARAGAPRAALLSRRSESCLVPLRCCTTCRGPGGQGQAAPPSRLSPTHRSAALAGSPCPDPAPPSLPGWGEIKRKINEK